MARFTKRRRPGETSPSKPPGAVRQVTNYYAPGGPQTYWVDKDGKRIGFTGNTSGRFTAPGAASATSMSAGSNPSRLLDPQEWRRGGLAAVESLTGISPQNSAAMNAALAAMAVAPVPGPVKKAAAAAAKGVARGASRVTKGSGRGLTQTVGEAVGEGGRKAANDAVGRQTPKPATGSATVTAPKTKPSAEPPKKADYKHASSHSRAVSSWQKKVDAWNKTNPNDKVRIATPDRLEPGKGKAATDTDRQIKKSSSEKTSAEKDTIAQGEGRTSSQRARERKAAERAETDLTDVEYEQVLDFVTRLRKSRTNQPKGAGKGKTKKTQADDILGTMRRRLRERDAGTDRLDGLGTGDGAPAGVRNPERFTNPTDIQAARATAQADRFEEVTGRKFPKSDDAVRRLGDRVQPGFAEPKKGSPEARRQAQAQAEAQADKANQRTRNLMDENRNSGEAGNRQNSAPPYPKGPDVDPRADRPFTNYSQPQQSRTTSSSAAQQNVGIGMRDGSVTPGRITSPQPDLGPRIRPVVGRETGDMRRFEMGDIGGEPRNPPGTLVTGPDTPPSMWRDPRDYPPLPGSRRPKEPKPREFNDVRFDDGPTPAQPAKPTGRRGGKKDQAPEQQPTQVDNSVEAVRARNYERYRQLERDGILEPGDADRIMSGGKGAKKVHDKTPTAAERERGLPAGSLSKEKKAKAKTETATKGGDKKSKNRRRRRIALGAALGTTGGVMAFGYANRDENNRPVVIPGREFDSKNSSRIQQTSGGPGGKPKMILRDKYGRKITRDEFNRREAFRASLKGMSASERKQARKTEMKRRRTFRSAFGKSTEWNQKSRNIGGGGSTARVLDSDARAALR